MEKEWKKYEKPVQIGVVTVMVYFGFRYLLPLFLPFLFAYFLAILLKRPVFLLKKLHIKPSISSGILVLASMILVGAGLFYGVGAVVKQLIAFLGKFNFYETKMERMVEQICCYCDGFLGMTNGSAYRFLGTEMEHFKLMWESEFMPALTKNSIRAALSVTEIAAGLIIVVVATILLSIELVAEDKCEATKKRENNDNTIMKEWLRIRKELSNAGIAYLKTQLILIAMVSATCCLGFVLIRNPYALLFGIAVGIFDAFPVLGSGLILVPWAVVEFLGKHYYEGAVLLTMYGICQVIREYLEPKLLGGKIGLRPIYTLMAVYVGFELFGLAGIFLGPIGLVLIRAVVGEQCKTLHD